MNLKRGKARRQRSHFRQAREQIGTHLLVQRRTKSMGHLRHFSSRDCSPNQSLERTRSAAAFRFAVRQLWRAAQPRSVRRQWESTFPCYRAGSSGLGQLHHGILVDRPHSLDVQRERGPADCHWQPPCCVSVPPDSPRSSGGSRRLGRLLHRKAAHRRCCHTHHARSLGEPRGRRSTGGMGSSFRAACTLGRSGFGCVCCWSLRGWLATCGAYPRSSLYSSCDIRRAEVGSTIGAAATSRWLTMTYRSTIGLPSNQSFERTRSAVASGIAGATGAPLNSRSVSRPGRLCGVLSRGVLTLPNRRSRSTSFNCSGFDSSSRLTRSSLETNSCAVHAGWNSPGSFCIPMLRHHQTHLRDGVDWRWTRKGCRL